MVSSSKGYNRKVVTQQEFDKVALTHYRIAHFLFFVRSNTACMQSHYKLVLEILQGKGKVFLHKNLIIVIERYTYLIK